VLRLELLVDLRVLSRLVQPRQPSRLEHDLGGIFFDSRSGGGRSSSRGLGGFGRLGSLLEDKEAYQMSFPGEWRRNCWKRKAYVGLLLSGGFLWAEEALESGFESGLDRERSSPPMMDRSITFRSASGITSYAPGKQNVLQVCSLRQAESLSEVLPSCGLHVGKDRGDHGRNIGLRNVHTWSNEDEWKAKSISWTSLALILPTD
jgi:hypothetical protein